MKMLYALAEKVGVFLYRRGYWIINQAARLKNGGEHPKHAIMHYHEFFIKNVKKGQTILDVGCGDGYVAWHVANKAKKVIGIDMDPQKLRLAKKKYVKDNLIYINGDATNYQFKTKIDTVILSNVLEHIKHRVALLKKLPAAKTFLVRVPLITRDWLAAYLKEQGYDYRLDRTHYLEYTEPMIREELTKAGLHIRKTEVRWGEIYVVATK